MIVSLIKSSGKFTTPRPYRNLRRHFDTRMDRQHGICRIS